MATAVRRRTRTRRTHIVFGPQSAGIPMTAMEFDKADFERGWRYELIHGVLDTLTSPLLPGFEAPLKKLFALADEWE